MRKHRQGSRLIYELYSIVWGKAVVTYKWCILFNEDFDKLVKVFPNRSPVESSKGNLKIE